MSVGIMVEADVLSMYDETIVKGIHVEVMLNFDGPGSSPYVTKNGIKYAYKKASDSQFIFENPEFKPLIKPEIEIAYGHMSIRIQKDICHNALKIANREIYIDKILS